MAAIAVALSESNDAPDDLLRLEDFSDKELLRCLKQRYERDDIFTWVGSVLVSVNPYRDIGAFSEDAAARYLSCLTRWPTAGGNPSVSVQPHLFAAVAGALASPTEPGMGHALLISGESGAGKTEATRAALAFLAQRCGTAKRARDRLLHSNPVLEAFGNAQTRQNSNSSRFGKFIDVHISPTGNLVGATLRPYMLEAARVVGTLAPAERTYHVFYYVRAALAALSSGVVPDHALWRRLVGSPDWLQVAKQSTVQLSNSPRLASGPSEEECMTAFERLYDRLDCLGMADEQILACIRTVAAVGLLADDATGTDAAVAALVGASEESFTYFLQHVETSVGCTGERLLRTRNEHDVKTLRVSVAQELYSGLFQWITTFVAAGIAPAEGACGRRVGLLDIYGFEVFPTNGFEQMLINYANERIQELFNRQVFLREAEEYTAEGLDGDGQWKCLAAACRLPALALLEGEAEKQFAGVFGVVSDRSRVGFEKRNDNDCADLVKALTSTCGEHPSFLRAARDPLRVFGVKHFAGEVYYETKMFTRKNARGHRPDIVAFLRQHGCCFVRELFSADADTSMMENGPGRGKRLLGTTLTSAFRTELNELCETLEKRQCQHIRCLRPNDKQEPLLFDDESMLRQCRYSGLLEATRIRKFGYAHRRTLAAFVERYGNVLGLAQTNAAAGWTPPTISVALRAVMQQRGVDLEEVCVGRTKIFIKEGALAWLEDMRLRAAVARISSWFQSLLRKQQLKVLSQRRVDATVMLQAITRGFLARVEAKRIRATRAAELEAALLKRQRAELARIAAQQRRERVEAEIEAARQRRADKKQQVQRRDWEEAKVGLAGTVLTSARFGQGRSPYRSAVECPPVPPAFERTPGRLVGNARSNSTAPQSHSRSGSNAPPSSPSRSCASMSPIGSPASSPSRCTGHLPWTSLSPRARLLQETQHCNVVNASWEHSLRSPRQAAGFRGGLRRGAVRPLASSSRVRPTATAPQKPSASGEPKRRPSKEREEAEALALAALEEVCRIPPMPPHSGDEEELCHVPSTLANSCEEDKATAVLSPESLPPPPARLVQPRRASIQQIPAESDRVEPPPTARLATPSLQSGAPAEQLSWEPKENIPLDLCKERLGAVASNSSQRGVLRELSQHNLPARSVHKEADKSQIIPEFASQSVFASPVSAAKAFVSVSTSAKETCKAAATATTSSGRSGARLPEKLERVGRALQEGSLDMPPEQAEKLSGMLDSLLKKRGPGCVAAPSGPKAFQRGPLRRSASPPVQDRTRLRAGQRRSPQRPGLADALTSSPLHGGAAGRDKGSGSPLCSPQMGYRDIRGAAEGRRSPH